MTESAAKPSDTTATVIDPKKTHMIAEFKHDLPLTTGLIDPLSRYVFAGAEGEGNAHAFQTMGVNIRAFKPA